MHEIRGLLAHQDGVVSRRQATASGVPPHALERLLRRRQLAPLHPGVYVDHTGTPTYRQRVWGALLLYEPAAAAGSTSIWLSDGEGSPPATVHLVVPRSRRLDPPSWIVVTRSDPLYAEVHWQARPPRVRYEAAAVQLAAAADDDLEAVAMLTRAVGSRRTTPDRLAAELARRSRLRRRRWLESVVEDLRTGTHSVLEHGYLQRVQRAHRLPPSQWQCRETVGNHSVYRDAVHLLPHGALVVELDGLAFHGDPRQRDRDYERDLDVAAHGRSTVRLSWGQVYGSPCRTAERIGRVMNQLGWPGASQPCGPACHA